MIRLSAIFTLNALLLVSLFGCGNTSSSSKGPETKGPDTSNSAKNENETPRVAAPSIENDPGSMQALALVIVSHAIEMFRLEERLIERVAPLLEGAAR